MDRHHTHLSFGRRACQLIISTALLLLNPTARAQNLTAPANAREPGAPWALRVTGDLSLMRSVDTGIELSARVKESWGLDVMASYRNMGHGYEGIGGEATFRSFPINGRRGLSLGIGPSVLVARGFGVVGFLQTEVAYELRPVRGIGMLLGFGPAVALTHSRKAECPDGGWVGCLFWNDHISPGDFEVRLRLAVGPSF